MYRLIKRIFDFTFACILLIICALPMLIAAIMIKLDDGGPVIYKQKRIGKNLKPFYIYKFRTMSTNRKELNSSMTHEQMVTKVGKILRKTSLDELPQLINIIKGEMSFIGPRPWIEDYYFFFTDEQKKRNDVTPGISGLAQVKGRNGITIFQKISYDLEYVNSASLWLDIKIFFLTIKKVLIKEEAEISEKGIKDEIEELKNQNKDKEYQEVG